MKLQEKFRLDERTILVTGATGYLGREISFAVAHAGATVLVNSASTDRCEGLAEEITGLGFKAEPAPFNVTDKFAIKQYFESREELVLHGLINNAYAGGAGSITKANDSDYLDSYQVSVVAAHNILVSALASLKRAAVDVQASVVNISSMYGIVSPDQRLYFSDKQVNPPFYGASKAALIQWTRYAACEFGGQGIRVNCISPGPFPSSSVQKNDPSFVNKLADRVPLGRVGFAGEIAGPTVFLLSEASSFVNGANLVVDGGWTCW